MSREISVKPITDINPLFLDYRSEMVGILVIQEMQWLPLFGCESESFLIHIYALKIPAGRVSHGKI